MPSLPHNSWAIDFLSHLVSNGTTAISTGAVPRLDNVIGSPSIQSIPTTPVLSVNTKFQNITTPLDNVSQETMAWFASYVMMQGIFFGAAAILLYQALTTALRKRNAITALNALQIGLWIGRTLILIIFSIAPGFLLDCYWLQYGAGAASSGVAICIWWLQFAKFKAIYANKTFTSFLVSILCIAGAVLKFSFIWEQVTVDSLDHCFTTSNVDVEDLSAYADVFINALFFILFGTSVVQQVSVNDKAWDRKFRLHFVFTCDVRGSLIVALSHVVKTLFHPGCGQ
ncbi:hypothetical protein BC830DRAFT_1157885 [Chytriomyces sp. MP71]|nr:hypothetical protein BC830DRAFT_1157885 [Chytriomyces sp. MP71]